MAPPLLTLTDMALRFGADPLFDGTELAIGERDRISLVGRNGSGKSTLMKVINGDVEADGGERFIQPGCHISYLEQDPDLSAYPTVRDYVTSGLHSGASDDFYQVDIILEEINLEPDTPCESLSGGERRRAALGRMLISEADIFLLDEPTNHLDITTIEWLEGRLKQFRGALVIISHDRAFLNNMTNTTFWLDRGKVRRLDKGFAHFDDWSATILEQETVERAKLNKLIEKETDWSHKGITARRKRNMGRMRNLDKLRGERASQIALTGKVKLDTDSGKTSGKKVIEARNISKSYGERIILDDFSLRIMRGDRIGIIGPNGAGKTTLINILTGLTSPDSGTVKLGTNLEPTYLDQHRTTLKDTQTIWETLSDGSDHISVRGAPRHIISYMKDFLFDASQAHTALSALSGGEKNRLLLAKTLAQPTNFLILDEPTNDLDMDTLDLLQEMLADYDGTLLLVSHDRDFLDRIVSSTIVMEGDGQLREYPGGYSDYIRQRGQPIETPDMFVKKQAPVEAPQQKRAKLSYKDQRALEVLPKEMAKLEKQISEVEARLADPELYSRDAAAFQKGTGDLEKLRQQLSQKEEDWLDVEMKREELES